MTVIHETTATLRFFGLELDPDEITRRLGKSPSAGVIKGEILPSRIERVARTGSWILKVRDQKPGNLDDQIDELLRPLSNDLSIWQDLTVRFQADVFCGMFMHEGNEGITLMAETMIKLGSRNLFLHFDIYDSTD